MKTKFIINGLVTIKNAPPIMLDKIRKDLTVENPEYTRSFRTKAFKKYAVEQFLKLYVDRGSSIIVPRGYMNRALFHKNDKDYEIIDNTICPELSGKLVFKKKLRDYQERAIEDVTLRRYGILEASTGAGKTIMALSTIPIRNTKTLILVHSKELLYQWREAIQSSFSINCGLIGDGKYDIKDITVGIINSVHKKVQDFQNHFGYVIYDECFAAGTLVDGVPIETLKVGDCVNSYNEKTKQVELKEITHIFKNKIKEDLLKITFSNGKSVVCTKNHPFYSNGVYLTADSLHVNSTVHSIGALQKHGELGNGNIHLHSMRFRKSDRRCKVASYQKNMHRMQGTKCGIKESTSPLQSMREFDNHSALDEKKRSSLFRSMQKNNYGRSTQKNWRILKQLEQAVWECQDERKKSNAFNRSSGKDENQEESKWHFECVERRTRREWENNNTTRKVGHCIGMGCRSKYTHNNSSLQGRRKISKIIQGRYRKPSTKNSCRSRWGGAQYKKNTNTRQEKRESLKRLRVVGIEIYKSRDRFQPSKMLNNNFTYNIEVADNNNYFVEGVLVHNCHRTLGSMWLDVINTLYPKYHLGVTATPFRNDETTKALFAILGPKLHVVDRKELEEIGAICIPNIIRVNTSFYTNEEQEIVYSNLITELTNDINRNTIIVEKVVQEYMHYKEPILIVSDRKEHCELLFNLIDAYRDLHPILLHGSIKKSERTKKVEEFKKGKFNVLIATVSLIGEGFDSPSLGSLFLTTPVKFAGRLLQVVGRILRPSGTEKPRVYDVRDTMVKMLRYSGFARDRQYKEKGWVE